MYCAQQLKVHQHTHDTIMTYDVKYDVTQHLVNISHACPAEHHLNLRGPEVIKPRIISVPLTLGYDCNAAATFLLHLYSQRLYWVSEISDVHHYH